MAEKQQQQHSEEKTFRNYNASQAASYASHRSMYPAALFEEVIGLHTSTGGQLDTVVDVGCGPGNATRDVAAFFNHAFGIDPSESMIAQAQKDGGVTKTNEAIVYAVAGAENCGPAQNIADGSVDLITAAMAAHWFDMPSFWRNASRMLRKGGTVAIWGVASSYPHPHRTPNVAAFQAELDRFEREDIMPFEAQGNRLCREYYRPMPLGWQIDPPAEGLTEAGFTRNEFNKGGEVDEGGNFYMGGKEMTVATWGKMVDTASPVTRWREANPQLAGTEKDCVRKTVAALQALLPEKDMPVLFGAACMFMYQKKE